MEDNPSADIKYEWGIRRGGGGLQDFMTLHYYPKIAGVLRKDTVY